MVITTTTRRTTALLLICLSAVSFGMHIYDDDDDRWVICDDDDYVFAGHIPLSLDDCSPFCSEPTTDAPLPVTFKKGARVRVVKEFISNDVNKDVLKKGLEGEITRIDEDGDAFISFGQISKKTGKHVNSCVRSRNFRNLEAKRTVEADNGCGHEQTPPEDTILAPMYRGEERLIGVEGHGVVRTSGPQFVNGQRVYDADTKPSTTPTTSSRTPEEILAAKQARQQREQERAEARVRREEARRLEQEENEARWQAQAEMQQEQRYCY